MSFSEGDSLTTYSAEISRNIEKREWNAVCLRVKEIIRKMDLDNGEKGFSEILDEMSSTLHEIITAAQDEKSVSLLNAMTECFRFFRNACAVHRDLQEKISSTSIFKNISNVLNILLVESTPEKVICLKVFIQFLGNSVVENKKNKNIVWKILAPHYRKLLESSDNEVCNVSCMVLYNILIGGSVESTKFVTSNISLILQCCSKGGEFGMLIMEYTLSKESLLEEMYSYLESETRLQLLVVIWTLLVEDEVTKEVLFPLSNLLFLTDLLKKRADTILTIVEKGMSAEPRETLQLLDIVACASSRSQYLPSLQKDQSLLISVSCLLKNVIQIGKVEGGNVFSSVQKLSEIKSSNESMKNHPVFGFKASLVRLIGNLCHQHKENQNQVREMDCLPAILDTCNIDVYNPLLMQWGILAIRNLLENNPANQDIVAKLVAQGPASNAILKELGLDLNCDENGSLCIAPLKRP